MVDENKFWILQRKIDGFSDTKTAKKLDCDKSRAFRRNRVERKVLSDLAMGDFLSGCLPLRLLCRVVEGRDLLLRGDRPRPLVRHQVFREGDPAIPQFGVGVGEGGRRDGEDRGGVVFVQFARRTPYLFYDGEIGRTRRLAKIDQ